MSEALNFEAANYNGETWQEALDRIGVPRYSLKDFKEAGWFVAVTQKKGGKFKGTLVEVNSSSITLQDIAGLIKTIDAQDIKMRKGKLLINKTKVVTEKEAKKAYKKRENELHPSKTRQRVKKIITAVIPEKKKFDWNTLRADNDNDEAEAA